MSEQLQDWRNDGVKVISGKHLDRNTPQT
ncbi:uncharacterized protein METZ01_LOCUS346892, partial [marine metagenome]